MGHPLLLDESLTISCTIPPNTAGTEQSSAQQAAAITAGLGASCSSRLMGQTDTIWAAASPSKANSTDASQKKKQTQLPAPWSYLDSLGFFAGMLSWWEGSRAPLEE